MDHSPTHNSLKVEEDLSQYFKPFSILVIGDLILDEYLHGEVSRLVFDRPIPVLSSKASIRQLGGAANLLNNISSICSLASLAVVGTVGDDDSGRHLRNLLDDRGIATGGVLVVPGRPTTHKLRVVAQDQHYLLRLDRERTDDPSAIS